MAVTVFLASATWTALAVACILACSTRLIQLAAAESEAADVGYDNLVAWMKHHGGRVDRRLGVATINGIRGAVALDDIESGAELLFCPWALVIGSAGLQDQMQTGDGMCVVVERMAEEMRRGEESVWHPYLNHIEIPRLAADWGEAALKELQGLEPSQDPNRHIRWFRQRCEGELDASAMRSLVAFISRASEVGMVPIYDLLNHHNGLRNAKLSLAEDGVHLLAVDSIEMGREIFLSYGLKTASTMFRDYGFVEDWPTCWNFKSANGDNFAFVLFREIVAINPTAKILKQIWQSNMPLNEYQTIAKRHTKSLSLHDMGLFVNGAQSYLDGLPTTLQGDEDILAHKRTAMSSSGGLIQDEDVIHSIEYRMAFKRALATALAYADAETKSLGDREL